MFEPKKCAVAATVLKSLVVFVVVQIFGIAPSTGTPDASESLAC